jgi:hypothetical protein
MNFAAAFALGRSGNIVLKRTHFERITYKGPRCSHLVIALGLSFLGERATCAVGASC